MLMVIFGAGASYDSIDRGLAELHPEHRPPLASALFAQRASADEVIRSYPRCRAVIPRLRAAGLRGGGEVERELQKLQAEQQDGYLERASHLMATRYYLRDLLIANGNWWLQLSAGITNYTALLDELARWRYTDKDPTALVTFNYDNLLERACRDVLGMPFNSLIEYTSREDFRVFKPHGSVDWDRSVGPNPNTVYVPDHIITHAASLTATGPIQVQRIPGDGSLGRHPCPAIAIPVELKSTFECPDEHLDALKRMLPNVDRLLVIGWRATEEHFLEVLRAGLANRRIPVMIVADTEQAADSTWLSLRSTRVNQLGMGRWQAPVTVGGGFSGFVTDLEPLQSWLRLRAPG